ncbi:MAG TPA: DUF2079 domain-containing protein, partial [Ktedonobacteraceae bacterium]|nr:DUF2079 domain-containing protein [Ktedonobacteraceae bacterium]
PALLVAALPDIAINVLSTHQEQYSGFYQYNAVILPYLMAAAISGIAAIYHARRRVEAKVATGSFSEADACRTTRARTMLQTISACWQAALGRLPLPSQWIGPLVIAWLIASAAWNINATSALVQPFWSVGTHSNPQQAQIDALLTSVPATASVAATDTLDPHLSDRYALYLLPDPQSYLADFVAIDLSDDIPTNLPADQQMYAAMLASGNYRIVGTAGQVVLLEHLSLQSPVLHIQGSATGQIRKDGLMGGKPTARRLESLKHGYAQSSKSRRGETRQLRVMGARNASRGRLL